MHHARVWIPTIIASLAAVAACTVADDDHESRGQNAAHAKKAAEGEGNGPPGNNGTVKIQEVGAPGEIPDNDPHVGCVFDIEFRGYDEGDLKATWALSAHPPSGAGTLIANGEVDIGEDAAGGANDLDARVTVDIGSYDLSGLTRHPIQGYHLKLEVHAEGSIGADKKHKVFWANCGGETTPEPEPDAGTSTSSSGGSSGKTW